LRVVVDAAVFAAVRVVAILISPMNEKSRPG
jgi:hypothetical protein